MWPLPARACTQQLLGLQGALGQQAREIAACTKDVHPMPVDYKSTLPGRPLVRHSVEASTCLPTCCSNHINCIANHCFLPCLAMKIWPSQPFEQASDASSACTPKVCCEACMTGGLPRHISGARHAQWHDQAPPEPAPPPLLRGQTRSGPRQRALMPCWAPHCTWCSTHSSFTDTAPVTACSWQ